ncbi:MAG TPA: hypothetical protein DCZ91_11320 [Lachnospiraceae bacterium]|nr:hypothetical protein [Lachnospiraceae bacterium]
MRSSDRIHDAFGSVKAGEELKSLTKEYLKTARQRENRRRRRADAGKPVFRRAFAGLCVMLVLALGSGGYFLLGIPVSYVSIDVNPSIELALNRLDRVIAAEAYNADGTEILDAVSLGGMHYTEAIDRLVESQAMQPYLSENAGLIFTVASDSGQRENALLTGIESTSGCREHGGLGYGADISAVQEAHESGLSLGKYAAWQILLQYDSSITTEDCHNMTMSEIHGLIEEHEHGEHDGSSGHNGSMEHGGSSGYGDNTEQGVNGSYGGDIEQGVDDSCASDMKQGVDSSYGGDIEQSVDDSCVSDTEQGMDGSYGTDTGYDGYGEHGNGGHGTGHGHSHE